ncbi:MAG: hypothetical protein AABZ13_02650, partial [Planctomycetota bacterium]
MKPPERLSNNTSPKGATGYFIFVIKTIINSRKNKYPSHVKPLFCRPFGTCYFIAFTRGFTPGYILSALRAC